MKGALARTKLDELVDVRGGERVRAVASVRVAGQYTPTLMNLRRTYRYGEASPLSSSLT